MPRFVRFPQIPVKLFAGTACLLACALVLSPRALAQRPTHAATGPHITTPVRVTPPHVVVPPVPRVPLARPPVVLNSPPAIGTPIVRFHRAPFSRFRRDFTVISWSWPNCGGSWGWAFGCGAWVLPSYPTESSVTPVIYEIPPAVSYFYGREVPELVNLYLKDGTAINVTDYWFVSDQVHFRTPDDGDGANASEQVISIGDLDVQRTISVNSRRGFRVVRRDEPLEQYLRDHPNPDPPLLQAPPKN